ncbi:MAG TPA: signal peptide peptidase SppA [Candidatus Bariatricus faecipullorum]|nr:signal peptide peptidase SppA [Candidatus Bariatricus faecipullorum]
MKKKQIIGLVVAAALFIVTGAASVLTNTFSQRILDSTVSETLAGGLEFSPPAQDYLAVVSVEGTIQEQTSDSVWSTAGGYLHTSTMEYLDRLMEDENNKGILLYVDSPGGTVYESEELYDKLMEYKTVTNRPIWCYMAHYAASGGYMAALAADEIFANQNTTTGSIGVILSGYDLSGLYEKLGIQYFSITSGEYKDSSQMTQEQMDIYQSQVDECYQRFVQKVMDGRNMSEEDVRALADGRTYTAQQAKENGLIDEISTWDAMYGYMLQETDSITIYQPSQSENILASLFSEVKNLVPKSEAQILKETAEEMESGVLMYYAEGLQ